MLLRSDISMTEEEGPESSVDYFHELEALCSRDSFWNHDGADLPEMPTRCAHCRHWIGQSDIAQHVQHVLNGCKIFMQQGRYDWRHNAVLNYIATCMTKGEPEGIRLHFDLPGLRTHDGGTVPDQLAVTELRPDICILDHRKDRPLVILVEVTVTWDGRLDAARQEKNIKYSELMAKISRQCPAQLVSLEVGSYRQKLSDQSKWSLKTLFNFTSHQVPFEVFEENILKITELCSYKIFSERLNPKWDPDTPFPIPPSSNILTKTGSCESEDEILTSLSQGPPPDLTKESLEKDEPDKVSSDFDGHLQQPDLLERTETRLSNSGNFESEKESEAISGSFIKPDYITKETPPKKNIECIHHALPENDPLDKSFPTVGIFVFVLILLFLMAIWTLICQNMHIVVPTCICIMAAIKIWTREPN